MHRFHSFDPCKTNKQGEKGVLGRAGERQQILIKVMVLIHEQTHLIFDILHIECIWVAWIIIQ